jgi:hypothetical protein
MMENLELQYASYFLSPSNRLVMNIKCEPNWVVMGPCTTPKGLLKTTSSNSFTIMPGLKVPKLPPRFPEGHSLTYIMYLHNKMKYFAKY